MPPRDDLTYAVHTTACTFLLDSEGICRRVVMTPEARKIPKNVENASRCIGAQYVASLDAQTQGCLVERPEVGLPLLFARADERGRIALVRTDNVTRFESLRTFDPFDVTSGVRTSAPELAFRSRPMRPRHASESGLQPTRSPSEPPPRTSELRLREEPNYEDPDARTQPIQRLSPEEIARALKSTMPPRAPSASEVRVPRSTDAGFTSAAAKSLRERPSR